MIQNYFGYMNLRESAVSGAVPANAVHLRQDAGPGRASPEMTVHGSTLMSMGECTILLCKLFYNLMVEY